MFAQLLYLEVSSLGHCDAGEGQWLQGEAAFQLHCLRDMETRPRIQRILKQTITNCVSTLYFTFNFALAKSEKFSLHHQGTF